MNKFLIIAVLLVLIMPFVLAAPQPQLELTGKQMIPLYGAPWIGDDSSAYFGNDKDVLLKYTSGTDKFEIKDTDVAIEEDATVGGGLTVTGLITANGGTVNGGSYDGDFAIVNAHTLQTGTGAVKFGGATSLASLTVNGTSLLTGIATFTAAPVFNAGFVLPAGVDITATSGGSDFDLSLATTGIFKTPGGAVTIGPGAIGISGTSTVATGKSVIVTDADKLTVGGVIVPQYWDFNVPIAAATVDTNIFIPTSNWQVVAVSEVHSVAGNDGSPVTAVVRKTNSTGAPSAGVVVTEGTFDLKGTANTIQTGVVRSGTYAWTTKVNATERLTLDVTGTLTTLAGGVITVRLKRI
jgi:hypothetical protein